MEKVIVQKSYTRIETSNDGRYCSINCEQLLVKENKALLCQRFLATLLLSIGENEELKINRCNNCIILEEDSK